MLSYNINNKTYYLRSVLMFVIILWSCDKSSKTFNMINPKHSDNIIRRDEQDEQKYYSSSDDSDLKQDEVEETPRDQPYNTTNQLSSIIQNNQNLNLTNHLTSVQNQSYNITFSEKHYLNKEFLDNLLKQSESNINSCSNVITDLLNKFLSDIIKKKWNISQILSNYQFYYNKVM